MKKNLIRLIYFLISLLLIITFTGCRNESDDVSDDEDFIFVPQVSSFSSFAGDLPNADNITATDSVLFFTSTSNMTAASLFRTTQIYRVNIDGSGLEILSGYTTTPLPVDVTGGGVFITAMHIDDNGYLWVAETNTYVTFDFPDDFDLNDTDEGEIWEYRSSLNNFHSIRKLDINGAELLSIDLKSLTTTTSSSPDFNQIGTTALITDDEDNMIAGSGQTILIFDSAGNLRFNLDTSGFITKNSFIRLSDGKIAYSGWNTGSSVWTLNIIDTQTGTWGDSVDLPFDVQNVFNGYGDYLYIFGTGTSLNAICGESNDTIQILNWIESGLQPTGLESVIFLPDDRIMFITSTWDHTDSGQVSRHIDLVFFNKTHQDEVVEKTVLTIASFYVHMISPAVAEFNRTNPLYRIEIIPLELNFGTMFNDLDKIALEMITGGGPDMINTPHFPFHQWSGRGFFVDLYEFLDADPVLSRSDFIESVLRGFELNGELYQLSPDFTISTLIGHPDVVGKNPGWNIEELMAVIEANPQAVKPFGEMYGGAGLIFSIYNNDFNSFVDWETGNVYFDTEFFINLLEFSYILDSYVDMTYSEPDNSSDNVIIVEGSEGRRGEPFRLVSSGLQIMFPTRFSRLLEYSVFQDLFGGDFVFKGFPVENGSGNSFNSNTGLAITITSKNQQGAWEFIKMVLSEDWQRKNKNDNLFSIPTNINVFNESLDDAMKPFRNYPYLWNDLNAVIRPLTQEHADNIKALIDSAIGVYSDTDPLWDMIYESLSDYYNGMITAQDAARIIQNRASIFVSEQS